MSKTRAEESEATFDEAEQLASDNGMQLIWPSGGCFQLRHMKHGWILNLYPRHKGLSPRAYRDPYHRGPFLELPENWTLLDAVKAACEQWNNKEATHDTTTK